MDTTRVRYTYHAETGKYPLYSRSPVGRDANKLKYDLYKNYVGDFVMQMGIPSISYAKWIEDKIDFIFGVRREETRKEFRFQFGYYPVTTQIYYTREKFVLEYGEWLEDKFVNLLNDKNINRF